MIAPFLDRGLAWDFRLPRVASINTSGHKYGLVYPGVGWVVWRDTAALPEELIYRVNYLGDEMATFALNFSRPGAQVVAQYYQFLRLGRDGYRRVQQHCRDVATQLATVFAAALHDDITNYTVFDLSAGLREHGWQVPAYTFPADRTDLAVLRFVIRNGMTHDLAAVLLADLRGVLETVSHQQHSTRDPYRDASFAHDGRPVAARSR
jgi:glutamate decarboxylase